MTDKPGSEGEHIAQEIFNTAKKANAFYSKQMLDYLNPEMMSFLGNQDLAFIATADNDGNCDASLRSGLHKTLSIIGNQQFIFPEYVGNGVLASVGNILVNQKIGMIFIDFVNTIGLHVNGVAKIMQNDSIIKLYFKDDTKKKVLKTIIKERKVKCWISVTINEAYIHCSKHIPQFKNMDKNIEWSTEDILKKGGDAFNAKQCTRPWV